MSKRHAKKEFDVLGGAVKIAQKGFGKGTPPVLRSPYERSLCVSPYKFRTEVLLLEYWREMLSRVRTFTPTEFRDEVAEMRHEIDILHARVESVRQHLLSYKETVDELCKEVYGRSTTKTNELATIGELCKAYASIVSTINIALQVLLVQTEEVATIWTIIDAPSFNDLLRTPIYDAQVQILGSLRKNIPLDFCVLNVSELPEDEKLESIIPSNAKPIWKH